MHAYRRRGGTLPDGTATADRIAPGRAECARPADFGIARLAPRGRRTHMGLALR